MKMKNTRKSLYHHINFACGNLYLLVKIKCNEIKNVYTTAISPFFTPITLSIKIPNPPPLDPNIKLRYKRYDKYLYRGLKYRYNAISKRTMPNIKIFVLICLAGKLWLWFSVIPCYVGLFYYGRISCNQSVFFFKTFYRLKFAWGNYSYEF